MTFILWLDASPGRYWILGLLLLALFVASAFARVLVKEPGNTPVGKLLRFVRHPAVFLVLGVLTILAFRWPVLFFPRLLDHDEAQMGAQAIKFFTDLVPWRSVDGTTSGPINSWWLMFPRLLGGEINWTTIRLMGLVCVLGTFLFTYGTLRRIGGDTTARVAVLPMAFFYMFVTSVSFLHYTSEHMPVLLLSGAVYFTVYLVYDDGLRLRYLIPAAILFGAVPFAKLQPTPLGALGGVGLLVIILAKTRQDSRGRVRALVFWASGGGLVPATIFLMMMTAGVVSDFFISYPGQLQTFKELGHPGGSVRNLLYSDPQAVALWAGCGLAIVVLLVIGWGRLGWRLWSFRQAWVWSLAYLGLACFCVLFSGKNYPHYFLFLVHPICLCLGVLVAVVAGGGSRAPDEKWVRGDFIASGVVVLVLAFQLIQVTRFGPNHPHVGRVAEYLEVEDDPIVQVLEKVARPGDRMTVWGMTPSYHVGTGLAPGTRDAITQMQILKTSRQSYYRERLLGDFEKMKPRFFVDTDSPFLMMTGGSFVPYVQLPRHGHEAFPELAELVQTNYNQIANMEIGETGYSIRVYMRNDSDR